MFSINKYNIYLTILTYFGWLHDFIISLSYDFYKCISFDHVKIISIIKTFNMGFGSGFEYYLVTLMFQPRGPNFFLSWMMAWKKQTPNTIFLQLIPSTVNKTISKDMPYIKLHQSYNFQMISEKKMSIIQAWSLIIFSTKWKLWYFCLTRGLKLNQNRRSKPYLKIYISVWISKYNSFNFCISLLKETISISFYN